MSLPLLDAMRRNTSRTETWALPAVIAACSLAVMAGGKPAAAALRYDRAAVLSGEAWRLVSGHFVHADWTHLAWNLAGLLLVFALFAREHSTRGWIAVMLASTAAIALGFLLFEPDLAWYVGLSGVLHGLVAAGLLAWLAARRDPLTVGVTLIFVVKLLWEHFRGPLPVTADTISVPVIHAAHSYGALGGTLAALVLLARQRRLARPL